MKYVLFVVLTILFGQQTVNAQKQLKVWVVRHAEKLADDANKNDPDLSPEGAERATDLMQYLKGQKIDTIYTTNYKRTKLTAFPLADRIGLSMKTYEPKEQKILAKQWIENAQGKRILIVGHSNTVLDIIEALGAEKPIKEVTEEDFDYIFEVTIKGNKADVKVNRYGKAHHAEDEKEKKPKR